MSVDKNYEIPFDKTTGELCLYARNYNIGQIGHEWRPNSVFEAVMEFMQIDKGQYSDRARFKDQFGKSFTMPVNDFAKVIKFMDHGILSGTFTFKRAHDKYGIKYIGN